MNVNPNTTAFTQLARLAFPPHGAADRPNRGGGVNGVQSPLTHVAGAGADWVSCDEPTPGVAMSDPTLPPAIAQESPSPQMSKAAMADIVHSMTFTDLASRLEPLFKQVSDKLVGSVMETHDADGDGRIAHGESAINARKFNEIDGDGDGIITTDELRISIRTDLGRAMVVNPALDADRFADRWLQSLKAHESLTSSAGANHPAAAPSPLTSHGLAPASPVENAPRPDAEAGMNRRQRLEDLASRIAGKLEQAGYGATPPVNIRELIEQFGLGKGATNSVIGMLAARYPQGLGIRALA